MLKKSLVALILPVLVLVVSTGPGAAIDVMEFDNPEQEGRYQSLIKELRCLVCQNQNLADSNADLAKDLREKVYEMIKAGGTEQEVVGYMVDRYGDFVLYRPPVMASTILLWTGPFVILLVCLWILVRIARRRRSIAEPDLDEEQHQRAQRLLQEDS